MRTARGYSRHRALAFAGWLSAACAAAIAPAGSARAQQAIYETQAAAHVARQADAQASLSTHARFARLSDALDSAVRFSRSQQSAQAAVDSVHARIRETETFFAGPAKVDIDLRRDTPGIVPQPTRVAARGRNEIDYGVSAPLWLPGEREARRATLALERELVDALREAERLELAGQLRARVWALRRAEVELELAEQRRDSASRLEADVARRVRAGDLARADLLLSTEETLASRAAETESHAAVARASAGLAQLTGSVALPLEFEELPAGAAGSRAAQTSHPLLRLADSEVRLAQARAALARQLRRENPSVSVSLRNDRDVHGADYRNSVRFAISIPLESEARTDARVAGALHEVAIANARRDRQMRSVDAEGVKARNDLRSLDERATLSVARVAAAAEALRLGERAYALGERSLPELLRLRAIERGAQIALRTTQVERAAAVAALNQSLGVAP